MRRGEPIIDVSVVNDHRTNFVRSVFTVDGLGRLRDSGGKSGRDRERFHGRPGLEPIGDDVIAARLYVRLTVVVGIVPRARRHRVDLPGIRIHENDRGALRLVGPLCGVEFLLGDVLDSFVQRQCDVVALKRSFVVGAFGKEQATAPVPQPFDLFHMSAQLLIEGELKPVFPLTVGRHETKHWPGQFATRIVAMPLAFHGEPANGNDLLLRVAEVADERRLVARDSSFEPDESLPLLKLRVKLVRVEVQRTRDPGRSILEHLGLRSRRLRAAQHFDHVRADAGHLYAYGKCGTISVVNRPALGLDVQTPLTLLLRHVSPGRAILDLDAIRARDEAAEAEPHGPG